MTRSITRRGFFVAGAAALTTGCGHHSDLPERIWGRRGVVNGDLVRPRAIAILPDDRLYIVDFTARIQAFDRDGAYLGPTFTTPDFRNGRPSGLGATRDGQLIVSDSHYATVRIYSSAGEQLYTLGGERGSEPGQFIYISDTVQAPDGSWFISEFGGNERITHLDSGGKLVNVWGEKGSANGQFSHIRAMAIGPRDTLYVVDANNHRVQVFSFAGRHLFSFGSFGTDAGQFAYPYDLSFGPLGDLYVVEHGNHRVQKLSADGKSLAMWGGPGREPGRLYNPWALAVDSRNAVQVVDTENHRVQRIRL